MKRTPRGNQAGSDAPARRAPVLSLGCVGALLLWLAQAPVGCWPLAYAGVACWVRLAAWEGPLARREWVGVWLAGALYWLLAVHWVRLPHPLTPIGWPLLAGYLGLYSLATLAVTRRATRRWGTPAWIAAPIAWAGIEYLQATLFTGFLMGAVSHSHAGQGWLRGVAAWVGAYGVTFAVVGVGGAVAELVRGRSAARLALVAAVAGAVAAAGAAAREGVPLEAPAELPARVALVQGDTRATWDADPTRAQRIMDRQVALTAAAHQAATAAGEPIDLYVWPESMFRAWLFTFDGTLDLPADADENQRAAVAATDRWLRSIASWTDGTPLLAGIDRFDWRSDAADGPGYDGYNSVVLADSEGRVVSVYDKTHLVPFGEYIPLANGIPALYYLTPMAGGLSAGRGPVAMGVPLRGRGELRICPSVCYESVVPHLIRGQVAELTARGERPHALVNVTNDAWFWGASELDTHLACGVFRAVENGLPLLVAANGGLSAIIDARGEVLAVGPRMAEHTLVGVAPPRSVAPTPYTQYGDWFAAACLVATLGVAAEGLVATLRRGKKNPINAPSAAAAG